MSNSSPQINKPVINRLCIYGVGLIGGSLALALKEHNYCNHIVGCSRNKENLQRAVELGVIDSYTLDIKEAAKDADIVLLAVPLGAMESILSSIKLVITDNTIITDAGSAKVSVLNAVKAGFGDIPSNFVAAHPIAGKEKSGVEAAQADLYSDHKVILTPVENTNQSAIDTVQKMWEVSGANVSTLTAENHDAIFAATSHLPHILSFALVHNLSGSEHIDDIFEYTAGGFKDFSRIASSDPVMWRDICLDNCDAILTVLEGYQRELERIKTKIQNKDGDALLDLFANARDTRNNYID